MSKYTTELRYICESLSGLYPPKTYTAPLDYCREAAKKIFDDDVIENFTDAGHGDALPNILMHFYTREIGYEVYGLFKVNLNRLLRENWYEYALLYESADLKISAINDVDYTREFAGKNKGSSESTSTAKGNGVNTNVQRFSDTPQGELDGAMTNKYLSSVSLADNTTDSENTSVSETANAGETTSTERIKGKQGSKTYAEMIRDYRKAIYNVTMRIINDCEPLFMQIW